VTVRYAVLFAAALGGALGLAVACGSGGIERAREDTFDAGIILGPDNLPAPTGPAGTGLATGLPCDVQALLENRCIGCHEGKTPNAPRLLQYADLVAPSKSDPAQSMARVALTRMKSATNPMPPAPAARVDPDELATMAEWVGAGTPKGVLCTDTPPDGGIDSGIPPLLDAGGDAAPLCTSGVMWTLGNQASASMHPGRACNSCHQQLGGPNLRFTGTVYRAVHDVDDCNGTGPPPPLTVEITDSNGTKITGAVNAAGNFMINPPAPPGGGGGGNVRASGNGNNGNGGNPGKFSAPFRAKIIDGAKTRSMSRSITSGDCNSCHTADGINLAPGRILAP